MRYVAIACLFLLVATVSTITAFADEGVETVAKLRMTLGQVLGKGNVSAGSFTNTQIFNHLGDPRADEISSLTFRVYTAGEIDLHRKEDLIRIDALEKLTDVMNKNIKSLADKNDALTVRMNDLEKKIQ